MREESRKLVDKGRRALKAAETLNTTVGSWMLSMSGSGGITIFRRASIPNPLPSGSDKLETSGRWRSVFWTKVM